MNDYLNDLAFLSPQTRANAYERFATYETLLTEWNRKFNLTAITDPTEIRLKHFRDSLAGAPYLTENSLVCDLGSGAGFPGIPLAIARGDCRFVLVDSLLKRVNFLNAVAQALHLSNCQAVHSRAEDFALSNRERFDAVTARAVAPLRVLAEYALPLLRVGGKLIAYKAQDSETEASAARNALSVLGGSVEKIVDVPCDYGRRTLIFVQKTGSTPKKYPRGGNKPRLMPL